MAWISSRVALRSKTSTMVHFYFSTLIPKQCLTNIDCLVHPMWHRRWNVYFVVNAKFDYSLLGKALNAMFSLQMGGSILQKGATYVPKGGIFTSH